jgi:sugar phosphate isomerase/epimerase
MMRSTNFCGVVWGILLSLVTAALAGDNGAPRPGLANPFFAFDNGTGRAQNVPFDEQARMLKECGYDGIGHIGTQQIPEMLKALDAQGLKMFSMYVDASVDPGRPSYDPGLNLAIEQLKGRDTVIHLPVSGGKPSSADLDGRAVDIIRDIARMAEKSGLRVAVYPHVGCYVARVDDAVRLVKKVDRKNVGVSFNLCHFLKLDDERNLERCLKEAMPYLMAVSINGTDGGQTNQMGWDRLIQTLDRGNFDVGRVLRTLKQLGYTGAIGLQCHGIPGDWRENLKHSMGAWLSLGASKPGS